MSAKPNARVAVQKAQTPDAYMGGYAVEDVQGECVQSEAVTLTDACGLEVLGPRPAETSLPVVATSLPSTLQTGAEFPIGAVAVEVLALNLNRVTGLVQNTGTANVRVGPAGVTPTTGYRLLPNQTIIYGEPNVNKGSIWAIREGANDSIAFAQEETIAIGESPSAIEPPSCRTCESNPCKCKCD